VEYTKINNKKLARLYLMEKIDSKQFEPVQQILKSSSEDDQASAMLFGDIKIDNIINHNEQYYEIHFAIFERAMEEIEQKNLIKTRDRLNDGSYVISKVNTKRISEESVKLREILYKHGELK